MCFSYAICRVSYEGDDFKDLDSAEVPTILIKDDGFYKDLAQKRVGLEKLKARSSVKVKSE